MIEEESLRAALDAGHLAGAALDVFASEPPPRPNENPKNIPDTMPTRPGSSSCA